MRDPRRLATGLGLAGAVVVFGIGWAVTRGDAPPRPQPQLPTDGSKCIEPRAAMVADHPALLARWRNAVVRDGERETTTASGERVVMSLTGTCLGCHRDRETFCARCHDFAGVEENCWNCHDDRSRP